MRSTQNDRLRSALLSNGYSFEKFANEVGVDPKTVQRWITKARIPHRGTANKAAQLLKVPTAWLWPDLEPAQSWPNSETVVTFYPHRAEVPKHVWMDLLTGTHENIDLFANASLFLPEDNPDAIQIIKRKAELGTQVRILLGDPNHSAMVLRGKEERLFDGLVGRIRMALAYYRPLLNVAGIQFRLHGTALYNSIFRYDNQMLINQHVYGTYGYLAPILHLKKVEGCDLFETYQRSFELVWEQEAYDADVNYFS